MITNNKYKTFWQRLFAGIIDGLVFIPFIIIDEIFRDTDNKWIFLGCDLVYILCYTLYCVVGHGKYGQTIGKKAMKIKVYSLDEKELIGYKRAFFRESVWLFMSLATIAWLFGTTANSSIIDLEAKQKYGTTSMIISGSWLLIEITTMFSNNKRRAVHDFLAGSVVIDQKEDKKEEMGRVPN